MSTPDVNMGEPPALSVSGLRVELPSGEAVVENVSFELAQGTVLGLVGESGCGKTTTALALLGYTAPGVRITAGSVDVAGDALIGRSERELRRRRGRLISYVPQDSSTSLNPSRRIGPAVELMLDLHGGAEQRARGAAAVLEQVQLPGRSSEFRSRFPHQLSGGQQQRVTIAIAIACEPPVMVLDEPTTGLDVVTQMRVLAEIERLRDERGLAIVLVSHDLAAIAGVADEVAVMYAGNIVERGPTAEILGRPRHPFTRGLVEAIPDHRVRRLPRGIPGVATGVADRPPGCRFAPRCPQRIPACEEALPELQAIGEGRSVRCIRWEETPLPALGALATREHLAGGDLLLEVRELSIDHRAGRTANRVVHGVGFGLRHGECLALVGESGSGKSTIARTIVGLHQASEGVISFEGAPLPPLARQRDRRQRQRIQLVFQNPLDSLNPRRRVGDEVARPARLLLGCSRSEAERRVSELLERVRLPLAVADRFPAELSGGERQRVAIARALAAEPTLVICDEITSSLDVSVQAAVLELLQELRAALGLSLLFITHDLGVVSSIADRVVVLKDGVLCESGDVDQVLDNPASAYTRELLAAAPSLREALLPSDLRARKTAPDAGAGGGM